MPPFPNTPVWAKQDPWPYWPAVIPEYHVAAKRLGELPEGIIGVQFLGWNSFGRIPIEKVLPWTEETVAEFRHNADYKGSKKFEDGIRHAEEFHKQLLEELAEENREKTEDGDANDGGAADRKKKAKKDTAATTTTTTTTTTANNEEEGGGAAAASAGSAFAASTSELAHRDFCEFCRGGGQLLCCESCPRVFHPTCLQPPLSTMPQKGWLCSNCASNSKYSKKGKKITTTKRRRSTTAAAAAATEEENEGEEDGSNNVAVIVDPKLTCLAYSEQIHELFNLESKDLAGILSVESNGEVMIKHKSLPNHKLDLLSVVHAAFDIAMANTESDAEEEKQAPVVIKSSNGKKKKGGNQNSETGFPLALVDSLVFLVTMSSMFAQEDDKMEQFRRVVYAATKKDSIGDKAMELCCAILDAVGATTSAAKSEQMSSDLHNALALIRNLRAFELEDKFGALHFSAALQRHGAAFIESSMAIIAAKKQNSKQHGRALPTIVTIIDWICGDESAYSAARIQQLCSHAIFPSVLPALVKMGTAGRESCAAHLTAAVLSPSLTATNIDSHELAALRVQVVESVMQRLVQCLRDRGDRGWGPLALESCIHVMEEEIKLAMMCLSIKSVRHQFISSHLELLQSLVNALIAMPAAPFTIENQNDAAHDGDDAESSASLQEDDMIFQTMQILLAKVLSHLHDSTLVFANVFGDAVGGSRIAQRTMDNLRAFWEIDAVQSALRSSEHAVNFVRFVFAVRAALIKRHLLGEECAIVAEGLLGSNPLQTAEPQRTIMRVAREFWSSLEVPTEVVDFEIDKEEVEKMEKRLQVIDQAKQKRIERKSMDPSTLPNSDGHAPYQSISKNTGNFKVKLWEKDDIPVCNCTVVNPCRDESCINRAVMIECTPGHCKVGDACCNQRIHRAFSSKASVTPFKTPDNRGWGLRVNTDVTPGQFIIEYVGEIIDTNELLARVKVHKSSDNHYVIKLHGDLYVDARMKGNVARFINHSCEPNCLAQKWFIDGEPRIAIVAKEPISAGTELSFEYKYDIEGEDQPCRCGTKSCVGFLGAGQRENVSAAESDRFPCAECGSKIQAGGKAVRCSGLCGQMVHKKCAKSEQEWVCTDCKKTRAMEAARNARLKFEAEKREQIKNVFKALHLPHRMAVGDIVWAKMKGFPWWPAEIGKLDSLTSQQLSHWNEKTPILVFFFSGEQRSTTTVQWVTSDDLKPWEANYEQYSQQKDKPARQAWLRKSIEEAQSKLAERKGGKSKSKSNGAAAAAAASPSAAAAPKENGKRKKSEKSGEDEMVDDDAAADEETTKTKKKRGGAAAAAVSAADEEKGEN